MKTLLRNLILSAAVILFSFMLLPVAARAASNALKVGDMMTDFTLPDGLGKGNVSFNNDIKGKSKVIILCFMTTACSACKAELTLLSDLANMYPDELKVYAVSVDICGPNCIPAYDKAYGFNVRYMLDPEFRIPQLFGFTYTPSLAIINKHGEILFLKSGYSAADSDTIINAVEEALKTPLIRKIVQ